ncbi:MAG: excinuclease ABC subunit UvrC [Planctomycetota bacterium]|nr:excinuclease ABC subunit UvrC [Planctomycetota bacterium]
MDHEALMEKIRSFPKTPGVYLMKDARGRVIYVGKAVSLRNRVGQYFQPSADLGPRKEQMLAEIADLEFLPADSEVDALLQEARLIKDIHPKYNVRLTDDKTFPYLEITVKEQFPGVYFTRTPAAKGTRLYGPFTSAAGLRTAIGELQKIFRFRTCNLDIREEDPGRKYFRPCILYAINRCTAPCAGHIDRASYRKGIARLTQFLEGSRQQVVQDLMREMKGLAKALKFEEAARVRDQLRAIEALALRGRIEENLQPEVFAPTFDPTEGLKALAKHLGATQPIRSIEGVDIANLGGHEAVGALVTFLDGRPFKPGYRRFRIQSVDGQDDFAMIHEVVYRRLRRLTDELSVTPDLILVDGGLGQLHAAAAAVAEAGAGPLLLASLAKREEEVYVLGLAEKEPLRLARTDAGLKLLQAVRDEAHRFAQHYHHLLRRKALFGEKTARELRKADRARKTARRKGGQEPTQSDGSPAGTGGSSDGSTT